MMLSHERDKEAARKCFDEALAQNPDDTYVLHQLGLLLLEEFDDRVEGEKMIRRATESNADNFAAWASLGNILRSKKDYVGALECYDVALKLRPDYSRALKNKGLVLQDQKRYVEARDVLCQALDSDGNNASIYIALGHLMEAHLKDTVQAIAYYEGAMIADPSNPQGYVRLGVIKDLSRDYEGAKAMYEAALKLDATDAKLLIKYATLLQVHTKEHAAAAVLLAVAYRYATYNKDRVISLIRSLRNQYLPEAQLFDTSGRKARPLHAEALVESLHVTHPFVLSVVKQCSQVIQPAEADIPRLSHPPLNCPRGHHIYHVRRKPKAYRPRSTWACEECKRSIGGADLRAKGAFYCATCKYDLCSKCAREDKRTAHFFPQTPTIIGKGGFGAVYREFRADFGGYVAVKHVPAMFAADVQREVELHRMFSDCEHIVRIFKLETDMHEARIYMELMQDSIAGLVKSRGAMHEREARQMLKGALLGLQALHSAQPAVVHRDVKPDNLLLDSSGHVKLADFGISKQQLHKQLTAMNSAPATTAGLRGTVEYMPPECFQTKPRWTPAVDVWALGCTWVAIITGKAPYFGVLADDLLMIQVYGVLLEKFKASYGTFELMGRSSSNLEMSSSFSNVVDQHSPLSTSPTSLLFHPLIPHYLSADAKSLLEQCFLPWQKRITVQQLLDAPYFSDVDTAGQTHIDGEESMEEYRARSAEALASLQHATSTPAGLDDSVNREDSDGGGSPPSDGMTPFQSFETCYHYPAAGSDTMDFARPCEPPLNDEKGTATASPSTTAAGTDAVVVVVTAPLEPATLLRRRGDAANDVAAAEPTTTGSHKVAALQSTRLRHTCVFAVLLTTLVIAVVTAL